MTADGPSARRGMLVGASWGVGHALALLGCGMSVAFVVSEIPAGVSDAFELAVAAMLVLLGGRAVARAVRHGPLHADAHCHATASGHVHAARRVIAVRPLLVGAVHGFAGSGALTALVLARLPSTSSRLLFTLLFGLGSIATMTVASGLAGWPLARLSRRRAASRLLLGLTGAASLVLGLCWGAISMRRLFG